MQEQLRLWVRSAKRKEVTRMVDLAGTSKPYLNQLINGHRQPSVAIAAEIAAACNTVRAEAVDGVERLPVVLRGDIHEVCRKCEYFLACKNKSK